MILKHSYSRIKDFLACPAYYEFKHIKKVTVLEDDADYLTIGKLVHEVIKEYTKSCYNLKVSHIYDKWEAIFDGVVRKTTATIDEADESYKIVKGFVESNEIELEGLYGVEEKICLDREYKTVDWESEEAFFRAVVDKLYIVGENCKIVDYKTGNSFKADRFQLEIYAWLVTKLYPKVKFFEFEIDFVRFGHKDSWQMTAEEVQKAGKKVLDRIMQIETRETFDTKIGSLCNSCQYAANCPAMRVVPAPIMLASLTNKEQAEKCLERIIALENSLSTYKEALKEWVEENSDINAGDMTASLKKIETLKWDVPALMNWANELGIALLDVLSVDKAKLKKTLSAELADKALMFATSKPSLRFTIGKAKEE